MAVLENVNFFALNFHMFGLIVKDVSMSRYLAHLDASPYEHFCFCIERILIIASIQNGATIEKAVHVVNTTATVTE